MRKTLEDLYYGNITPNEQQMTPGSELKRAVDRVILYYYNESTGELEFICKDQIAEDGTVSLAFTHASDYVIAIDGEQEEESGNATEPEQPDTPDKDSTESAGENPQAGQAWRPWWLIVAGALVIIVGIGVFFGLKKKQEDENSGQ